MHIKLRFMLIITFRRPVFCIVRRQNECSLRGIIREWDLVILLRFWRVWITRWIFIWSNRWSSDSELSMCGITLSPTIKTHIKWHLTSEMYRNKRWQQSNIRVRNRLPTPLNIYMISKSLVIFQGYGNYLFYFFRLFWLLSVCFKN